MPIAPPSELELVDDLLVEWAATPKSKANARCTLDAFAAWLAGRGSDLASATQADCVAWLAERGGQVAAATVVKQWGQLLAFYRIAAEDPTDILAGRRSPMARAPNPAPQYVRTKAPARGVRRPVAGVRHAHHVSCAPPCVAHVPPAVPGELPHRTWLTRRRRPPVPIKPTRRTANQSPPDRSETMTPLRRACRRVTVLAPVRPKGPAAGRTA
jgi:hypothetical protein